MKILYAEGNFLEKGHQILAYPASVGNSMSMPIEKTVIKMVPEVKQSIKNMFSANENYDVVPPALGDVIWTQTSGSKWYAHCIVYDDQGNFSYPAFELCLKSLKKKAKELKHDQIGFPLQWFPKDVMEMNWARAFPVIEEELGEEDDEGIVGRCQAFVYDPDSKFLEKIVSSLPGTKRAYYADVQIRFRDF